VGISGADYLDDTVQSLTRRPQSATRATAISASARSTRRAAAPHAKCIHGQKELNRKRIEDVLRDGDKDDGEDR
jgi:hypothetical protein